MDDNEIVKEIIKEEVKETGLDIIESNPLSLDSRAEFDYELKEAMEKKIFPTVDDLNIIPPNVSPDEVYDDESFIADEILD